MFTPLYLLSSNIQFRNGMENILGEEVFDIYHIGSTSVNGLKAKPIIDIMPTLKIWKKQFSMDMESYIEGQDHLLNEKSAER